MQISNILYANNRKEWRRWLEKHFDKQKEIWLVFPNKSSGKKRIEYNDAVEEALCFGWIDSIVKSLDKDHCIQRFTPRNPKSSYSQPNIERLKYLLDQNLVHPSVESIVKEVVNKEFIFPPDIIREIVKDKTVWKNFNRFAEPYKRIRIAYIEGARKRPEEFKKRLKNFIEKTAANKIIKGHGGIDRYYY